MLVNAPAPDEEALKETRFPSRAAEHLPSVVEVSGADLRVDSIDPDWRSSPNLLREGLTLPSVEEVRSSLWLDASEIAKIRESVYECHDMRVVRHSDGGKMEYLATRRLEPRAESNLSVSLGAYGAALAHEVPINGCWWAPGGRIRAPKAGSALAERGFDRIDSLMLKLNEELGIQPEDVLAIHYLGKGETKFERRMEYRYEGRDHDGAPLGFVLPVEMPRIQHTINHNFVALLKSGVDIEPRTLSSPCWIDRLDFDRHKGQFLEYERKFIAAVLPAEEAGHGSRA